MIRMNPVDSVVVLYSIFEKNHKKNLNVLILQHLSVKLLFLSIFTTLRSTYHRHIDSVHTWENMGKAGQATVDR